MSTNPNVIQPNETRLLGFYFYRKTTTDPVNPTVGYVNTETTFSVSNVSIIAILGTIASLVGSLEYLGGFLSSLVATPSATSAPELDERIIFNIVVRNCCTGAVDMTEAITELPDNYNWANGTVQLGAKLVLGTTLTRAQSKQLEDFRDTLGHIERLSQQTLVALNGTKGPLDELLKKLYASSTGDKTGSGSGGNDPQSAAWAKGLFNRITTGGPNGSMAGKIAVNFMSTVPVAASFAFSMRKPTSISFDDQTNPIVQILKDAVTSAAESAAQGLADYLKTLRKPSTGSDQTDDDRQVATVVKGIKDSMPATGRTVAQLAVFNALGDKNMADLPRAQQLRVAYTVANATRSAVEATGNHIADLYQTNSIPEESELVAVGARSLLDFLKSVGTTVANGVLQAAPVVLNAVVNSASANGALGSTLPPDFAMTATGVHELDTPTKIILASRIVNGTPNAEAGVVADKAVSDLADRQSNLGAQATLDTFTNTSTSSGLVRDSEPTQDQRDKFRNVALEVANISPTFSNVTDIGATNLVTDTALKHADSLRQSTLEMGIRSCANMIADHQSAEILYKVHLYRLKNGLEVQPRSFTDFLKTAVPIAANIAKVAAPALLALL